MERGPRAFPGGGQEIGRGRATEFKAQLVKVAKDGITFSNITGQPNPSNSRYTTLPVAGNVKVYKAKLKGRVLEAGEALPGGLQNENA